MPSRAKFLKAFAQHIDKLREERNLSFQQMADACKMDKAQVYKICTVGVDLRVTSIVKLAKGLKVSVSAVLDFLQEPNSLASPGK